MYRTFVLLLGLLSAMVVAVPGASAATYEGKLRATIKNLPVKAEYTNGYDRDAFKLWTDTDGDSCDTRQEVLIAEAKVKPTVSSSCDLTNGEWVSYYDGATTTDPSTFDIDHMVPLAEAYHSGAYRWNEDTRTRYANDLGDARSLVAVSATSNRSKSDRDPAEWMPSKAKCRYVAEYVAVKVRWGLAVDSAEKKALAAQASKCKDVTVRVVKAKVVNDADPTGKGSETGMRVKTIAYDPAGTDTLNGEYVVLTNAITTKITLGGWVLKDEAGTSYTFPNISLAPGATVTLYTGSGTNSSSALYAGRGTAWWNNTGDKFYLYNPTSSLKQTGAYQGAGDGSSAQF